MAYKKNKDWYKKERHLFGGCPFCVEKSFVISLPRLDLGY